VPTLPVRDRFTGPMSRIMARLRYQRKYPSHEKTTCRDARYQIASWQHDHLTLFFLLITWEFGRAPLFAFLGGRLFLPTACSGSTSSCSTSPGESHGSTVRFCTAARTSVGEGCAVGADEGFSWSEKRTCGREGEECRVAQSLLFSPKVRHATRCWTCCMGSIMGVHMHYGCTDPSLPPQPPHVPAPTLPHVGPSPHAT